MGGSGNDMAKRGGVAGENRNFLRSEEGMVGVRELFDAREEVGRVRSVRL